MQFKFVHAADLHLDAVLPLAGVQAPGDQACQAGPELWREAPFLALRRLVDFCLAEGAALLLLAGDVYDSRQGSLKARLELCEACQRLKEAGVQVFWARGNHDPLEEDKSFINWPDNLTIFDTAGQSFALDWENGQFKAARLLQAGAELSGQSVLVHGLSHAGPRESANLAQRLRAGLEELGLPGPGRAGGNFSLGVLHCNVGGPNVCRPAPPLGGQAGAHENYAPCSLGDLTEAPLDYWALGHIHQPGLLAENPYVVYAGCPQGLHVRESGERGCWLGQVAEGRLAELNFHHLAPLRWERLELDLSELEAPESETAEAGSPAARSVGLEDLEEFILREIQAFARGLAAEQGDTGPSSQLVLRLILSGRTALDGVLRKGGNLADLAARLNQRLLDLPEQPTRLLIKDIKPDTRPGLDLDEILAGDNLVAETLRRALSVAYCSVDDSKLRECLALLDVLYASNKAEAWLADLKPGLSELSELAREAAAVCLDLFEVE